jgi:hypothetical protein
VKNPAATRVAYGSGCPDCATREVDLPQVLPTVGDDFDWDLRDYDSFRQFMLEALAARFPGRRRWTAADVEVALAETLAAQLDKLSDMLDRVAAEFTLETARRPETVRRLLAMIGHDVLSPAWAQRLPPFDRLPADAEAELDPKNDADLSLARALLNQYWLDHPEAMDQARQAGPRAIRNQRRMVTLDDYAGALDAHPLVTRAHAWQAWGGAWQVVHVAVIPRFRRSRGLDDSGPWTAAQVATTTRFHRERNIPLPDLAAGPSLRCILHPYIEAYRMAGQPVELRQAEETGIVIDLSIQVADNYYQSEVRHAAEQALGSGPGGFFEPGRLRFGEDLWASDLVQTLMALDGVRNICVKRFKRFGERFRDMASEGHIVLDGLEVAICDNLPDEPGRGYFRLTLSEGKKGSTHHG